MESAGYIVVVGLLGGLFFLSAIAALYWASKRGQLTNLEEGSRVIFDAEEPEGSMQDHFPGETPTDAVAGRASRRTEADTHGS